MELTWHLDITGVNSPGVDAEQAGPDGDRQVRPGIQIAFWIHPLGPDTPKRYETNSDTTVQQVLDKLGFGGDYNLTTILGLPVKPGLQLHELAAHVGQRWLGDGLVVVRRIDTEFQLRNLEVIGNTIRRRIHMGDTIQDVTMRLSLSHLDISGPTAKK